MFNLSIKVILKFNVDFLFDWVVITIDNWGNCDKKSYISD